MRTAIYWPQYSKRFWQKHLVNTQSHISLPFWVEEVQFMLSWVSTFPHCPCSHLWPSDWVLPVRYSRAQTLCEAFWEAPWEALSLESHLLLLFCSCACGWKAYGSGILWYLTLGWSNRVKIAKQKDPSIRVPNNFRVKPMLLFCLEEGGLQMNVSYALLRNYVSKKY